MSSGLANGSDHPLRQLEDTILISLSSSISGPCRPVYYQGIWNTNLCSERFGAWYCAIFACVHDIFDGFWNVLLVTITLVCRYVLYEDPLGPSKKKLSSALNTSAPQAIKEDIGNTIEYSIFHKSKRAVPWNWFTYPPCINLSNSRSWSFKNQNSKPYRESAFYRRIFQKNKLQVLNNLTITGLIFSEPSVDGTKYPPTLASKFSLRVGSTAPDFEFEDAVDESRWWADSFLGDGVFIGELEEDGGGAGAPMTWTMACVSILWISIVPFGRREVMYG